MNDLTENQRRLAMMVRCGYTNREIAEQLGTTPGVVRNYLTWIYRKLGITGPTCTRRVQLAVMVVRHRMETEKRL